MTAAFKAASGTHPAHSILQKLCQAVWNVFLCSAAGAAAGKSKRTAKCLLPAIKRQQLRTPKVGDGYLITCSSSRNLGGPYVAHTYK